MVGVIDVKVQSHNPNFPLEPVFTFINSAQSFRIRNVPRAVGKWNITNVFVRLVYPDNTTIQKECVLNGNIWIGTVEGCAESGTSTNGFIVTASGIDEDGNNITNYVLGAGDLYVKDLDGTIDPERVGTKMYFNDTLPSNPKKGDATFIDSVLNVYDGANWVPVAESPDPSFIIDADGNKICADRTVEVVEQGGQTISDELALKSDLPTKTSDLTNDSGFITSADVPTNTSDLTNDSGFITSSDVPTKTSDLTNDSGFITSAEIEPYHDFLTPTENTGVAKQAASIALTNSSNSIKPDSYLAAVVNTNRDLTDKFTATMGYNTYYPYNLEKYFEQTFSPALELKFCYDKIAYMAGGRPRTIYTGYMFRTGGAGFAMPCSEDGTPDGRLYETTDVTTATVIIANQTTSLHQLTFSDAYGDPYRQVATVDGQSEQMTCWRTNNLQAYATYEELANKSDIPTKTSDLTNDSGFITSADIITKRDLNDFNVYGDPLSSSDMKFKFKAVGIWGTHQITEGTMTIDPSAPTLTWVWTDGQANCSIEYTGESYVFMYEYLSDGTNSFNGQFTLPIIEPKWSCEYDDDIFVFTIVSSKGTIATQNWVLEQLSALEARISALENL